MGETRFETSCFGTINNIIPRETYDLEDVLND